MTEPNPRQTNTPLPNETQVGSSVLGQQKIRRFLELSQVGLQESPYAATVSPMALVVNTEGNGLRDIVDVREPSEALESSEKWDALMSGRIRSKSAELELLTESQYAQDVVGFIAEKKFGGDLSKFDLATLKPQDYHDLLDALEAVLDGGKGEVPSYGEASADGVVQAVNQNIIRTGMVAEASGDPGVIQRAHEVLSAKLFKVDSSGYPIARPPGKDDQIVLDELIIGGFTPFENIVQRRQQGAFPFKRARNNYLARQQVLMFEERMLRLSPDGRTLTPEGWKARTVTRERLTLFAEIGAEREAKRAQEKQRESQALQDAVKLLPMNERLNFRVFQEDDLGGEVETAIGQAEDRAVLRERDKDLKIDPDRVLVNLPKLKAAWEASAESGKRLAVFARGETGGQRAIEVDDRTYFDEYVFVVLKEQDASGEWVERGVIADSPVAGHNAAYIFRNDTDKSKEYNWRDVFKLKKWQARLFGARQVMHVSPGEHDSNERTVAKLKNLMIIEPDLFEEKDHRQIAWWIANTIGGLTLK